MKFEKKGLIFKAENRADWWLSHTQAPTGVLIGDKRNIIRMYLGAFGENGITRIGYADLDARNPKNILAISEKPVLDLGRPGAFDDNGVFPATAFRHPDGRIFLYYTGFHEEEKVRYTMFGGLAISDDDGRTFRRASEAPITDRSDEGLLFRGGPSVLFENGKFRTYYSAGSDWAEVGGKLRPCYNIYTMGSDDGIHFPTTGKRCLSYDPATEHGIGRPHILKTDGQYHLFFCVRTLDMRYKIGHAASADGLVWTRDDDIGIVHAKEGWDSGMIYFPTVVAFENQYYLFYCGNWYGKDGFGYAELISMN